MNFKQISLIFLIFCALFLSICAISAADNASNTVSEIDDVPLEHTPMDTPIKANESTSDNTKESTASKTNTTSKDTAVKKLKASAPYTVKEYKKKGSFKVTVKDLNKKPMKKLLLKVKVYTGKTAKTYKIKTNSKGVATLSTKSLKKGSHKVEITSANKKYTLKKKSTIYIGVKKTLTLKLGQQKDFKNGDYFNFFKQTKNRENPKGVYVDNRRVHDGGLSGAKSHHIIKVKYTFKNIKGMTITKVSTSPNMMKTKLIIGYEPVSAKITYIN